MFPKGVIEKFNKIQQMTKTGELKFSNWNNLGPVEFYSYLISFPWAKYHGNPEGLPTARLGK